MPSVKKKCVTCGRTIASKNFATTKDVLDELMVLYEETEGILQRREILKMIGQEKHGMFIAKTKVELDFSKIFASLPSAQLESRVIDVKGIHTDEP